MSKTIVIRRRGGQTFRNGAVVPKREKHNPFRKSATDLAREFRQELENLGMDLRSTALAYGCSGHRPKR